MYTTSSRGDLQIENVATIRDGINERQSCHSCESGNSGLWIFMKEVMGVYSSKTHYDFIVSSSFVC